MPDIRLFSTLAVRLALDEGVLDDFARATGHAVETIYDPTNVLLQRIAAGDRPDVMIGVRSQLEDLALEGILNPPNDIARVGVGIAAAPGPGPLPSIATVDDLTATLLEARSVAYSRTGASGIYFASLLSKLGIAEAVNQRATIVEKGFTAEALIDGRADLAVQQLSELRFVPKARLVGPFPDAVQHYTVFATATATATSTTTGTVASAPSKSLATHLATAEAIERYIEAGLEAPR